MSGVVDRTLRPFALVITDRRWAAPLSAAALGFGLFVGVAIGPNAAGTLAGATQILEMPRPADDEGETEVEDRGSSGGLGGSLDGEGGGGLGEAPLAPAPLAPAAVAPAPEEEPASKPAAPAPEEPAEETEEEAELKGVVVQANPAAGSYALAIKGGELVPIHARKLALPGSKLTVTARRLANGAFAEVEPPERSGKATQASFRGVVTYVDPDPAALAYTVSGRGASLLVQVEPDPTGAAPQLPARGSYVTVTAELRQSVAAGPQSSSAAPPPREEASSATVVPPPPEPSCARDPSTSLPQIDPPVALWQRRLEVEPGEPSTYLDLAGVLTAVCPQTEQLLLSADGLGESENDLTLTVPAELDPGKLRLGDSVLATATAEPDGSLVLAGLADDEQIKGADDAAATQGDLRR